MGLQEHKYFVLSTGFWNKFPTFFLIGNSCILIEVTLNFNIPRVQIDNRVLDLNNCASKSGFCGISQLVLNAL
jgi:hypothetical protein